MIEQSTGTRLVTQNLLTSASAFERAKTINWQSIQDLSALIDILCLYDRVAVLGRDIIGTLGSWQSDLLGLMEQAHLVEVRHPSGYGHLITTASRHLATFIGGKEIARFEPLLKEALLPTRVEYLLEAVPDGSYEIEIGREWLLTTPSRADLIEQLRREATVVRGAMFFLRTFLYLAYSDEVGISFTPDSARCPALETVMMNEEQFRGRLLKHMKRGWEEPVGDLTLLQRVSPFATTVFMRAGHKRDQIVPEIAKLRDELSEDRRQLLAIEDKALWGSRSESLAALAKYNAVINELANSMSVPNPIIITLKFVLNLSGDIGAAIAAPKSFASWGRLAQLPFHIIQRLVARRAVAGIHRLIERPELPASAALNKAIGDLFGPVGD